MIDRNLVEEQVKHCYHSDIDNFVEDRQYRLSANIDQHLQLTVHCTYSVRDASGNELCLLPYDQVYQHFLYGQVHGLGGEPYEVQEIDNRGKVIKMVHTNRHASAIYRHVHKVTINHLHEGKLKQIFDKVVNGWQIRAEIFELDLTIHTNGYHSFIDGWWHHGYIAIPDCPERRYQNGRTLLLNIQSQDDLFFKRSRMVCTCGNINLPLGA